MAPRPQPHAPPRILAAHIRRAVPRFHKERKNIFNARRELSLREPKGCYVSHSQFADEAVRSPAPSP